MWRAAYTQAAKLLQGLPGNFWIYTIFKIRRHRGEAKTEENGQKSIYDGQAVSCLSLCRPWQLITESVWSQESGQGATMVTMQQSDCSHTLLCPGSGCRVPSQTKTFTTLCLPGMMELFHL